MIIRRRTYGGKSVGSYGYFMRNTTFMAAQYGTNYTTNIYTKCMQKEAPVGSFGYLTSNSTYVQGSGSADNGYAAVGYTDGTTIIVANAKNLYRSTNKGASFDLLCTWNNSSYLSYWTGPVVFIGTGSPVYYYVLYVEAQQSSYTNNGYYYLKVAKIDTSGNISSRAQLKSGYYNRNVYSTMGPFDGTYGSFFHTKPSPLGQIMIQEVSTPGSSGKVRWIVVDLQRLKCSGVVSPNPAYGTNEGSGYATAYEACGQWFNDGSTYGAFHFMYSTKEYVNGSARTYRHTYFKVTTNNTFTESTNLTVTNITSSLSTIVNANQWVSNGSNIGDPNIFIASCDQKSTLNRLFILSSHFNTHDPVKAYVCNRDFTGLTEITLPSDLFTTLRGGNTWSKRISGICITPDGKYGVALYSYGAWVCDLESKQFVSAYCFAADDSNQNGGDMGSSFMLPAK